MEVLLSVRDLKKTFKKGSEEFFALSQVSFDVAQGDCLGIIGFSGAGKSTLLRCLSSLEPPSSGKILAFEKDIALHSAKDLVLFRKKIGMVFQHFQLFSSKTVSENVAYPLEILGYSKEDKENRVQEILALVGLSNKSSAYPSELSGGEKQRVGIARALAHSPKILFCDEPTSALDAKTKKEILQLLKKLQVQLHLTIVIITHEMGVIKELCNKVVVLDKGAIVEMGFVEEVFSSPKHATTQKLLDQTIHEIPSHLKEKAAQIYRLTFKGQSANRPIISELLHTHAIEVNILMGWIDSFKNITIGNLLVEFSGNAEDIEKGLKFLQHHSVNVEKATP